MALPHVVEIAILTAVAVPLTRLFRIDGFLRAFPRSAALVAALILGYLCAVAILALRWPSILPPAAVIAAVVSGAAWWFSRPNYGLSRGLPPGSLSLVSSLEAIFDQRFYLKQVRRHGPVFKMLQFHTPVVCVVGIEEGHELIRLPDDILSPAPQPFSSDIPGGFLRYMAPETHAVYAAKFRAAFSRKVTAAAEPVMREAIRAELARMARDSKSHGGVRPAEYLYRAMFVSFARLIFGLLPESEDTDQLWSTFRLFEAQQLHRPLNAESRRLLGELRLQLLRQIERLQRAPGTECVVADWLHSTPGTPDQTVLDNLIFLFRIGVDNITGLLRWVLKMLADHPHWAERVRQEGLASLNPAEPSIAERIVFETLRLEQSEYLYRTVKSTLAIGRYRVPPGWRFRLCVRECHRDPVAFQNPEDFDPDRFLGARAARIGYSPFGTDRHACLAVPSIHSAARIFVEELARGFKWEVTADGPRERPPRHWHHWKPSSQFSLSLWSNDVPD